MLEPEYRTDGQEDKQMEELINVMDELIFCKESLDLLLVMLKESENLFDLSNAVIARSVMNVTIRALESVQVDFNSQLDKMDEVLVMDTGEEGDSSD